MFWEGHTPQLSSPRGKNTKLTPDDRRGLNLQTKKTPLSLFIFGKIGLGLYDNQLQIYLLFFYLKKQFNNERFQKLVTPVV